MPGEALGQLEAPSLGLSRQGSLLHARNLPTIPSPPTSRVQPGFSHVHIQHWHLSLAAGNSIPLGASLTTRRLAQHGPPYRVRYPTDWPFTFRCSPRWIRSNAVPLVTGGELLPEADFHRPDCATRRRTSAAVSAAARRSGHLGKNLSPSPLLPLRLRQPRCPPSLRGYSLGLIPP